MMTLLIYVLIFCKEMWVIWNPKEMAAVGSYIMAKTLNQKYYLKEKITVISVKNMM